MRRIVVIHYPESELEDEAAIIDTQVDTVTLEQALERAKSLVPAELDRLDRTGWILRKTRDMVHGLYIRVNSITTLEVEG